MLIAPLARRMAVSLGSPKDSNTVGLQLDSPVENIRIIQKSINTGELLKEHDTETDHCPST